MISRLNTTPEKVKSKMSGIPVHFQIELLAFSKQFKRVPGESTYS